MMFTKNSHRNLKFQIFKIYVALSLYQGIEIRKKVDINF